MSRQPTFTLVCILVAVLGVGCQGADRPPTDRINPDDRMLRRGNGGDPETLDPALAQDVHAFNVLADLFEGLVTDAPDGALIPGVAETWAVSSDGRVYEFTLRPDAKWSNGDLVVAEDFVRAFRRVADPETASAYGFLLEPLENFAAIAAGHKPASELGIQAIHDRLLVLRLEEPSSHFLSVLAMPIASPMHAEASAQLSYSNPDQFISNGAYILTERQINGPIVLRRNAHYWNAESVRIGEVMYLPITNESAELNMFRAGELDITDSIPSHDLDWLITERPTEVRIAPKLALYYIAFDLSEEAFSDRQLRKALSLAIDRHQIVRLLGRGEEPAFSIVPPGVANHVSAMYEWRTLSDAERIKLAQSSFRSAGYDASSPFKIKLTYDVGDVHERVALAVAAMWKEVLGVETELEKMEWKYFLSIRDNRSAWQTMRFAWFGDYNDPMTFAEIFRSDSPQNLPLYANTAYDQLLDEAMVESDTAKRIKQMTDAEKKLIEDYPVAPVYFFVSKHLVSPHVAGFEDNVLDRHPSRFLNFLELDQ